MYILAEAWRDGYLDYCRAQGQVRIAVRAWAVVSRISGVYFERPRSVRLVWNYLREFGPRTVLSKVRSRLAESVRNRRAYAVGLGQVCEADAGSAMPTGTPVAFVAPCHPLCVERIVLPAEFAAPADPRLLARAGEGVLWLGEADPQVYEATIAAWDPLSGTLLPQAALARALPATLEFWRNLPEGAGKLLALSPPTQVRERTETPARKAGGLSAVVFGWGNMFKATIKRWIDPKISLDCIHEIEPTQLGPAEQLETGADTSPVLRDEEQYDVYFIAGYHHTHADLAVAALERGGYAVVEKPPVTNRSQFDALRRAIREYPGRFFACYNKRYNPLWRAAREDLGVQPGEPVHYQCIVFEVPLPPHHWYRWPNSGSRLISNGCHWLDHFLFMNDYQQPRRWRVWENGNGDVAVNVDLVNGASLSLVLTDHGSERIGVQDHIEMRANGVTVRVDRACRYVAEGPTRILRKKTTKRLAEHRVMYQTICRNILRGSPGDSLRSFEVSSGLLLELEEALQAQRRQGR